MKKKNSVGSILAFPILLIIGVGLLWWNEGNYVKTAGAIKEAKDNFIQVDNAKYDSKNDNKLIATNAEYVVNEDVVDNTFNIKIKSAKLDRKVEMYQWDEDCDEDDNCSYDKEWSSSQIDSSSFQSGHNNPTMPYESESFYSNNVTLGDFQLSQDNLSYISTNKSLVLTETDAANNKLQLYNNYLYKGNPNNTQIGDVRISFKYLDAKNISIIGVQSGNNITKYVSKNGKKIMYAKEGIHTGDELCQIMSDNNKKITWLIRLIGFILLVGAFGSLFAPLKFLTGRIPILGDVVGTVSGLFALLVGGALSVIVIAIAWLRFRPLISVIAIAVVVAIVLLFIKLKKNKKAKEEVPTGQEQSTQPVQPAQVEQPTQPIEPVQPVQPTPNENVQNNDSNNNNINQ